MSGLPITGERTVPGVAHENYWFRRHEAAYRWAVRHLPVRGAVVVDAGCGEGYGADLLAAAGAAAVVGIDLDEGTLRHVRSTYAGVRPVRANLVALPLADDVADVVVSCQVVEHLWDQDRFVAECARVLRPGGRLVVTTPNRRTFPPGNVFHSRELDAAELTALIGRRLAVDQVLGLRHGARLADDEASHGDLVTRVVATPTDEWDDVLAAHVGSVTADDFVLDRDAERGLDLLVSAVQR